MEHDSGMKLRRNLEAQEALISKICRIAGAPGLSISVLHRGTEVYSHHVGHASVKDGKLPDGDTIYFIGSMTKAMVSALVGILVQDGTLDWKAPVSHILPELAHAFDGRGSEITLIDLMSHRIGMARADALWLQCAGNILLSKSEALDAWISQPTVRAFRADFLYSNFAFEAVGRIIEKSTGKTLGANLQEKIFGPLGMTRTCLDDEFSKDPNAAKAYFPLKDGTPVEVPVPTISDKTIMAASGGVRSCTNDLARFYKNLMHAANDQFNHQRTSTPGSPFKQLSTIWSPHNQLPVHSMRETSYALAWARTQLPSPLGSFNYNKHLVPAMPVIGRGLSSRLVVYHGGSMQGFTSAVYLLPETETAVFALQNSSALCDACDWVPQMLVQTILSGSPQSDIDFVQLATVSAARGATLADEVEEKLQRSQEKGTNSRPLKEYVGRFWHRSKSFRIDVTVDSDETLRMCFQGMPSETYSLRHLHHDVFVWNEPHDVTARRGRFQTRPVESYRIRFGSTSQGGVIDRLYWLYDETHAEPGLFRREGGAQLAGDFEMPN
ncbi:beta-lactamase and DUF3471 domain protein [Metarhizium robertsii]|uniref:Beta-lactamase family protein n=2 Tax=Metarhizium robertsii TaxID=568076 RepID=E9F775_METRA|nr:beta-lactamase family protein [Metarhizium robertsii ARSEF 23]EFY96405.1 beta-lactamase family protein [Metarhizium robertsii ARSEF 23]EXU97026.1 beta-lactamase and DUF3471 domain protein [Metarhizium robertsii]